MNLAIFDVLSDRFEGVRQWVFEQGVEPMLYALGAANWLEDGYSATGWMLAGVLQVLVVLAVLVPLQRWRPVEHVTDRAAVRVDVLYTLIHRLGLFRLGAFLLMGSWVDGASGWLTVHGIDGIQLDDWLVRLWPGPGAAWLSFAIYLVAFDFVDYWIHRGQHNVRWWWELHALHHSQRQMTAWSDNRNHLLDDLLRDLIFAAVARFVGVPPGQFVALVVVTQLIESLSHSNIRMGFGALGERLLVSPRYHRVHHAMGVGLGEKPGRSEGLGGCNYAVLFPLWDLLFGTADLRSPVQETGIRDQLPEHGARDYGRTFWAQQKLGVLRLLGRA